MKVMFIYLLLMSIAYIFAVILFMFIYLVIRKTLRNRRARKKVAYFFYIYPKVIEHIKVDGNPRLLEIRKRWKREVVANVLLEAVSTFKGREEIRRINQLCEEIGLTDELETKARDKKWWVAAEATRMAGQLKLERLTPILLQNMSSKHYDLWTSSARALSHMQQYRALIQFLFENEHKLQKWSIIRIIDMLKNLSDADVAYVIEKLKDASPFLQGLFIEILGKSRAQAALISIEDFLDSEDVETRVKALRAIASLQMTTRPEKVISFLESENWLERLNAILVIKSCHLKTGMRGIVPLLSDRQWWIRFRAAETLYSLGSSGIDKLKETRLIHEDRYAREMAERILYNHSN
ncbi:HEAT repeat domain-containing protein [Pseudalkalibacillus sp. Hm43]|uniref:HEAT repeat domain-containing protein n=1 Tax=Pseudalkalibacillus sp. Hm43 TaxID=3450742 RepID=UPI003F43AA4D